MNSKDGLRSARRIPLTGRVRVGWEDEHGYPHMAYGRCFDISATGLGLEMEETVPVRGYVNFEVIPLGFKGSASVRFVRRKGLRNVVGLDFSGGLRWNPGDYPASSGA